MSNVAATQHAPRLAPMTEVGSFVVILRAAAAVCDQGKKRGSVPARVTIGVTSVIGSCTSGHLKLGVLPSMQTKSLNILNNDI